MENQKIFTIPKYLMKKFNENKSVSPKHFKKQENNEINNEKTNNSLDKIRKSNMFSNKAIHLEDSNLSQHKMG